MNKITTNNRTQPPSRVNNREIDTPENSARALQAAQSAQNLYQYQVPRPKQRVDLGDEDLPVNYDTTRLRLLSRDPHFIHAYWELAPKDMQTMQQRMGPEFDRSNYVLRMHDVTNIDFNGENSNQSFDIDIAPHINNWYINLWCDNVSYCGELGMRTPEGHFHPYAQSNVAMTPRNSSSGRSDMIWMDVKANRNEAFVFTWPRTSRAKKAITDSGIPQARHIATAKKIFISEDDIRAYYANLYPLLRRIRGFRPEEVPFLEENIFNWERFQGEGERIEDLNIPGISKSEYYRKFLQGASAELLEKKGASEQIFSGASQQLGPAQRNFFFELWTELIVYGRTEPDAQVKLNNNQIIKLRPDGTFTLRYALPDGRIPLDFTAISHDQVESRRITTAVERTRTMYSP